MAKPLKLDSDRLFPIDSTVRAIARRLYESVKHTPIISPHGHTDPHWFASNENFTDAVELLLAPDHYLYRMLYSQGIYIDDLCVPRHGKSTQSDRRKAWRIFAENFYLFRATPSSMWLNQVFFEVFGFKEQLSKETADDYYDQINAHLKSDAFKPRALFERFNIALLSTTEGPTDRLVDHKAIRESGWAGRVIPTYRPDAVIDASHEDFDQALREFGELTGEDVYSWQGYLSAHRKRRAEFRAFGATATDHGHSTCRTANLDPKASENLYLRIVSKKASESDVELFQAQMLTEMARMSLDDGMVMQIHPGAVRNHNHGLFLSHGRDKGADIPQATDYVHSLKPLLDAFGTEQSLSIILFTLDESTYARELAPLAGHYPALRLGPAWWFHDSPEGMYRFRRNTTETAGFYNTVGFNDDTRAFLSIPARHDMARRVDAGYLATLVADGRLSEEDAFEVIRDLTEKLPKAAYKL